MKLNKIWTWRALALVILLALLWLIGPAWQLWRTHESQWNLLSQVRLRMLQSQQEVQALRQKSVPTAAEATAQIQAIGRQRFGATAVILPGASLQMTLRSVAPEQLASGWNEIRSQTSASLVQADLTEQGQGWSGTLVFKLAQKP